MKTRHIIFIIGLASALFNELRAQPPDPVEIATESNSKKTISGIVENNDAEFLVNAADSRMMALREGKLAAKKGTSSAVREYGKLMVEDQNTLLNSLRSLALKKKVTLPTNLSDAKQKNREQLARLKKGKAFDDKFINAMIVEHEQDVTMFRKALGSNDEDVKAFAREYLPMIESHLARIKLISGRQ
ncbi:DUF4142 domain-containing protein [Chryseolinea sp. T2]|uniref:DUF4142 domain-containing protein n=1 Tax=Chryseolinea sp. T2 TaxID=3129255 RepID=UPI003077E002